MKLLRKLRMAKIRVLIADDHEMVRKGVRKALEEQSDINVVDEAADGAELPQE